MAGVLIEDNRYINVVKSKWIEGALHWLAIENKTNVLELVDRAIVSEKACNTYKEAYEYTMTLWDVFIPCPRRHNHHYGSKCHVCGDKN